MRQLKNYYIYTSRLKSCRNLNKILKLKKNLMILWLKFYTIKTLITLRMLDAANHQEKKKHSGSEYRDYLTQVSRNDEIEILLTS